MSKLLLYFVDITQNIIDSNYGYEQLLFSAFTFIAVVYNAYEIYLMYSFKICWLLSSLFLILCSPTYLGQIIKYVVYIIIINHSYQGTRYILLIKLIHVFAQNCDNFYVIYKINTILKYSINEIRIFIRRIN